MLGVASTLGSMSTPQLTYHTLTIMMALLNMFFLLRMGWLSGLHTSTVRSRESCAWVARYCLWVRLGLPQRPGDEPDAPGRC